MALGILIHMYGIDTPAHVQTFNIRPWDQSGGDKPLSFGGPCQVCKLLHVFLRLLPGSAFHMKKVGAGRRLLPLDIPSVRDLLQHFTA